MFNFLMFIVLPPIHSLFGWHALNFTVNHLFVLEYFLAFKAQIKLIQGWQYSFQLII
jgi:hypothetical protein